MKNYFIYLQIIFIVFLLGCNKKNLPEPNPLNTAKKSSQNFPAQSLVAPCDSILENNKITYTETLVGNKMFFYPELNSSFDYLEIICRDNSSYNNVRIKLPIKSSFIGKVKYDVKDYDNPSSTVATISHSYNSYYYQIYYSGYQGSIYAEYTKTQIILTFCSVKSKNNSSEIHEITGKITVPYTADNR